MSVLAGPKTIWHEVSCSVTFTLRDNKMDDDERDYDLVLEVAEDRRKKVTLRRNLTAWDEPPGFYDDDNHPPVRAESV